MATKLLFNGGITVFLLYMYYHISMTAPARVPGNMDGADWPKGLLVLCIFFLIVNIINIFRRTPAAERNFSSLPTAKSVAELYKNKLFLGILVIAIYAFILPQLGFLPASLLMATCYMTLLGEKRLMYAILYSFIAVVVLYMLFSFLLGIMLPRGFGPFRDFALMLESIRFMF